MRTPESTYRRVAAMLEAFDELPLTLNTAQAARACGVSPRTMRKWIAQGLPTLPFEGDYRISTETLIEYLRGRAA